MTPSFCTCTWLLLPCVLVTLSTGELKFYRDEVADTSENALLRQLVKYIESQGREFRLSMLLANQDQLKRQMQLDREKERSLMEELTNNERINEQINERIDESPRGVEEYYSTVYLPKYFAASDRKSPYDGPVEYRNYDFPYPRENVVEEPSLPDEDYEYDQAEPFKRPPYDAPNHFDKGMKEEPLSEYQGVYRSGLAKENDRKLEKTEPAKPAFTYRFDDENLMEKQPFAVKPNDPRYYEDARFDFGDFDPVKLLKDVPNGTRPEMDNFDVVAEDMLRDEIMANSALELADHSAFDLTDLQRRTYNPFVVPINRTLNNDIYFIAIVAGCSAAAMFAFVLITLTWCRLKRGAKAAADIEYPAYGVTGPNKEVSPSGDQRLAQSAQMYHFQHQKQQIIALENRVSASRDPGSVSEAESEEENEEGDYTVYECRGLASTGEMEVRNPLFHDDPTPVTPHK
ncbi:uncharacterized protein LOC144472951 [Augochlora pura]